jgi:hypothetical protein
VLNLPRGVSIHSIAENLKVSYFPNQRQGMAKKKPLAAELKGHKKTAMLFRKKASRIVYVKNLL